MATGFGHPERKKNEGSLFLCPFTMFLFNHDGPINVHFVRQQYMKLPRWIQHQHESEALLLSHKMCYSGSLAFWLSHSVTRSRRGKKKRLSSQSIARASDSFFQSQYYSTVVMLTSRANSSTVREIESAQPHPSWLFFFNLGNRKSWSWSLDYFATNRLCLIAFVSLSRISCSDSGLDQWQDSDCCVYHHGRASASDVPERHRFVLRRRNQKDSKNVDVQTTPDRSRLPEPQEKLSSVVECSDHDLLCLCMCHHL